MTKTKREDEGAPPHGDPAAFAFALEGAEHDPAIAKELRAYLRKQASLAELQAEELKDELVWRHWSLRVRHISDVLKLAFELSLSLIFTAIVVAIGVAIWSASQADGLVVEAFDVPQHMTQAGLTGPVVASKFLDRLTIMQNATNSTRAASSFANDWTNDIKVEIPDTGVSLGEAVRFLRSWLGHETHLSGDVYEMADGSIALTARLDGDSGGTFMGKSADLDQVVKRAAEAVFARAQPYRYGVWLSQHERYAEGVAVYRAILTSGNPKERAWAHVGLAISDSLQGRYEEGDQEGRRGLEDDPHLPNLLTIRRAEDDILGHSEAALRDARLAAEVTRRYGREELSAEAAMEMPRSLEAYAAEYVGDYARAVALQTNLRMLGSNDLTADRNVAVDAAWLHDFAPARAYFSRSHPGGNYFSPIADASARGIWLIQAGDAKGAIAAFEEAERLARERIAATHGFWSDRLMRIKLAGPWLAHLYAATGDWAKSDAALAELPQDSDYGIDARAKIAALRHDWKDAALLFLKVSARTPSIPLFDTDWGEMLLAKGDLDGAIAKFAAANEKGPHFADPLELWGETLIAKNRSDLALEKFAEADKYAPNWGRLHLKWGEALFYSGRRPEAQKQFAIAAHLDLTPAEKSQLSRVSHV